MSDDQFLARLKERAERAVAAAEEAVPPKAAKRAEPPAEPPQSPERPQRQPRPRRADSAPTRSYSDRRAVAFWQSEIAQAHICRRISGDEEVPPARYFAALVPTEMRTGSAVVLRGGDPSLACELLREGACGRVTILDDSQERLDYAQARIPEELRGKVQLANAELHEYEPEQPPTVVAAVSALHRLPDPDAAVARIAEWLAPGGLVYVDEFVGPDRFQWTERQVEIVNRLLACLPEELRRDLSTRSGAVKEEIGRPDPERFERDHPSEAVAPSRIRPALDAHLDPVTVKPYGGAVFHQLFARIMGNFARRPELVRLVLEFDATLTDLGAVESDYLWGAYRRPS